jgi:hypothetical protein
MQYRDHDPANERVFRYLAQRTEAKSGEQPVELPDDPERDYYLESGAHPDIVERLWDQLGKALPADSRALVFGVPALVHRASGIVLAFASGTQYALRLPESIVRARRPAGLKTVVEWTGGGSTDIARECGQEWIFGSFDAAEAEWCAQAFQECERGTA